MAETEDAERIVGAILERQAPEVPELLYVDDLISHAGEFQIDLERFGNEFPCALRNDGELVPLAPTPWLYDWYTWRSITSGDEIVLVPRARAREVFRTGMVRFLSSRIRSLSKPFGLRIELPRLSFFGPKSATVVTVGFPVDVSASPKLRVHVSPTFRRKWRFFASPTSPASGKLTGGIYEFAVDGGPYPSITPDKGTFDIPYQTLKPALAL